MRPLLFSFVALLIVTAGCSALVDDAPGRETVNPSTYSPSRRRSRPAWVGASESTASDAGD